MNLFISGYQKTHTDIDVTPHEEFEYRDKATPKAYIGVHDRLDLGGYGVSSLS